MRDSVTPISNRKAIQDEAALWVVRMDQRALSEQETQALKSWLRASSTHARIFRETVEVYGSADILLVLSDLFPLEPVKKPKQQQPLFRQKYSLAFAACAMVLVTALSVFMWQGRWDPFDDGSRDLANYSTLVGGKKVVVLSDGSTVILNTDTSVAIRFNDQRREVVLERGEAYFEVAKNPERPFVVYAGDGQVTAVGTAFSVRMHQSLVEVAVTEGKVAVQSDRAERDLLPLPSMGNGLSGVVKGEADQIRAVLVQSGQVVTYDDQVIAELEIVAPEVMARKMIWQQGMLAFEAEPLENVIAEFSRFTHLEIIIADDELKAVKVDGYFKSDDITGMLDSLQYNFGIEIARLDKDRIRLNKGRR